jgi:hypothetical protein
MNQPQNVDLQRAEQFVGLIHGRNVFLSIRYEDALEIPEMRASPRSVAAPLRTRCRVPRQALL